MRSSLSLLLAALLAPASARAEEPSRPAVGLSYTRGPGAERCPEADALWDKIGERIGDAVAFVDPAASPNNKIEVTLGRKRGRLTATWTRTAPGAAPWTDDDIVADTCERLLGKVALRIAAELAQAKVPPAPRVEAPAPAPPPAAPTPAPPSAPEPAPRPGAWEGQAGIGRIVAFAISGAGLAVGTGLAVGSAEKERDVGQLEGALGGSPSACSQGGAACAQLASLAREHDVLANAAIGCMVGAAATAAAAVASIWIVRTPSRSVEVQPTAPGALAALTFRASW
jgi:hypothetical protein